MIDFNESIESMPRLTTCCNAEYGENVIERIDVGVGGGIPVHVLYYCTCCNKEIGERYQDQYRFYDSELKNENQ